MVGWSKKQNFTYTPEVVLEPTLIREGGIDVILPVKIQNFELITVLRMLEVEKVMICQIFKTSSLHLFVELTEILNLSIRVMEFRAFVLPAFLVQQFVQIKWLRVSQIVLSRLAAPMASP